ncbi:hypothetical protein JF770_07115 [Mycobacterium intracellulare]|uniref:hypothetical protein n=1 Tax=Mycobacterium intracellulare TaxID=1767 RepID=UPI000BAAFC95|nr:hypothetical protein [Mycobacterium intracellulare]ASW83537.1 hypothetical protein CKJ61_00620 [Mycobacterium intracellulare]MCA2253054.1 hypothetical protein [Mycobacterium intracellulare]MCA2303324.1 hypothetical protein [Mycobacterium intracellulare]MCA2346983.1 hypothetical protein [Mycobacterium intracellulare]UGU01501.1 hypothetical protein LTS63_21735 [Mycobacterium intracellulare]
MTVMQRPAAGFMAAREAVFPLLAAATIVASTDVRIPLGLPGHRGLVWLTLLVAVALVTVRRETVLVVGAASTVATLPMHGWGDPLWSSRYVAAAALLYTAAALPAVRVRRWLLAPAAGPIHLVALASSVFSLRAGGHVSTWVSSGLLEKAGWHLVFGLSAGLLAWVAAMFMGRNRCEEWPL